MDGLFSNASVLGLALGYVIGAVPFGLVLTRLAGLGDIRQIGSKNIGATNVLRTGNRRLAMATLVLDIAKGTIPVLIAASWLGPLAAMMAGLGAFLGHLYPVWLKFKGGKGVATYIGVLLGLSWPVALGFCGVWLMVALLSRYSSFSALVASAFAPLSQLTINRWDTALLFAIMSAILVFRHRENISRLLAGTEPKIGEKA